MYNQGAAFGLHLGPYSRWIFFTIALVAVYVLHKMSRTSPPGDWFRQLALGLVAGGRHQRVLVVQRNQVQHEVADRRLRRPDHALHAARTLLQLQPDHRRPAHRLQRRRHPWRREIPESEDHAHLGTEGQKVAPAHAALVQHLTERFFA